MNLIALRRRLTQAAATAEKAREKAEREGTPATRDVEKGRAMGLREAVRLVSEMEAKE